MMSTRARHGAPAAVTMRSIIVVVDIETSGPNMRHNFITEIGAVVYDVHARRDIDTFSTYVLPAVRENNEWDTATVESFWKQHQEAYNDTLMAINDPTKSGACAPRDAVLAFYEFLQRHAAQRVFTLVSDHPTFDFGWLQYYLDRYGAPSGGGRSPSLCHLFAHDTAIGYAAPLCSSSLMLGFTRNMKYVFDPATSSYRAARAAFSGAGKRAATRKMRRHTHRAAQDCGALCDQLAWLYHHMNTTTDGQVAK